MIVDPGGRYYEFGMVAVEGYLYEGIKNARSYVERLNLRSW